MEMRCAGKSAMNAGRYYYKCPLNGKHPGSFMWCDEYPRDILLRESGVPIDTANRPKSVRSVTMQDELFTGHVRYSAQCSSCGGSKQQPALMVHVLIIFMALVLIILGVLIGKVM
ncbi:hypothetical protein AAHA92_17702 [Salvia divinorum]|uniref:Zinc finger GRF-type domain-containing protein n=1 Tax=Salvia divinorum TaxID=28513 RepID=A0ABD1GZQ2_SALDI